MEKIQPAIYYRDIALVTFLQEVDKNPRKWKENGVEERRNDCADLIKQKNLYYRPSGSPVIMLYTVHAFEFMLRRAVHTHSVTGSRKRLRFEELLDQGAAALDPEFLADIAYERQEPAEKTEEPEQTASGVPPEEGVNESQPITDAAVIDVSQADEGEETAAPEKVTDMFNTQDVESQRSNFQPTVPAKRKTSGKRSANDPEASYSDEEEVSTCSDQSGSQEGKSKKKAGIREEKHSQKKARTAIVRIARRPATATKLPEATEESVARDGEKARGGLDARSSTGNVEAPVPEKTDTLNELQGHKAIGDARVENTEVPSSASSRVSTKTGSTAPPIPTPEQQRPASTVEIPEPVSGKLTVSLQGNNQQKPPASEAATRPVVLSKTKPTSQEIPSNQRATAALISRRVSLSDEAVSSGMSSMFNSAGQLVRHLLEYYVVKGEAPTSVAESPQQELAALYSVLFGCSSSWRGTCTSILKDDMLLAADALHAVIAAALYNAVFTVDLPWQGPQGIMAAMGASGVHVRNILREHDLDLEDVLWNAELRKIQEPAFRESELTEQAQSKADAVLLALHAHLYAQKRPNLNTKIDESLLTTRLVTLFKKAMLLKARMDAASAEYSFVWYSPGTSLDRSTMEELYSSKHKNRKQKVVITAFPAVFINQADSTTELCCEAMVVTQPA